MRSVTGIPELDRRLAQIGEKGANRACRSALGKAKTQLKSALKAAAPKSKGGHFAITKSGKKKKLNPVRDSIDARFIKSRRTGEITVKAGIDVGKKLGQSVAYHAHLVALGTGERFRKTMGGDRMAGKARVKGGFLARKSKSLRTGRMPANPFIARGFASARSGIESSLYSNILQGIEKEATLG